MARGRWKRRGYHQRGYKLDGNQTSEDLCPYCYSFGCDPMSMSPKFREKISERLRKHLCPCCGEPIAHCKCKSSSKIEKGIHTIHTHNNRKRRKALSLIKQKEAAWIFWRDHPEFAEAIGGSVYEDIEYCLYRHKKPPYPYEEISCKIKFDVSTIQCAWQ